ncbi:hypothetical protein SMY46_003885 [Cronobacter turicensis]|uniref:hypothetical protein n=1 Tax=Cronobacter dublinensis TaxID=413497 RepID=UPI00137601D9|nr:hypothetical protein [Cronobacter dublinensis]ELY4112153.1 hypothetical protein [Cronobacter turicensis]ELZ8935156.1 hypothetical protein [Cronobacter dublinensis]EMA8648547.1 hypothetical protein [Cronobacter turicensis]NCH98009.1 hypothetical protein [Cronobacter dublinensis]
MAKRPLERPEIVKPATTEGEERARLTNFSTRKRTTTEAPKTVRMTAAEKMMAQELVEQVQALTNKNITLSTILRAGLYMACTGGPEKVLKVIKENI